MQLHIYHRSNSETLTRCRNNVGPTSNHWCCTAIWLCREECMGQHLLSIRSGDGLRSSHFCVCTCTLYAAWTRWSVNSGTYTGDRLLDGSNVRWSLKTRMDRGGGLTCWIVNKCSGGDLKISWEAAVVAPCAACLLCLVRVWSTPPVQVQDVCNNHQ